MFNGVRNLEDMLKIMVEIDIIKIIIKSGQNSMKKKKLEFVKKVPIMASTMIILIVLQKVKNQKFLNLV